MEVFSMVVWIVAIAVFGGVANNYIKAKSKRAKLAPENEGLEQELDELRTRIETLERIVTDESSQLAREINQLEKSA